MDLEDMTAEEVLREVRRRANIMRWMDKHDIRNFRDVTQIVAEYYENPDKIMEQVYTDLGIEPEKIEEEEEVDIEGEEGEGEEDEAIEKELASIEERKTALLDKLKRLKAQVRPSIAEPQSIYGKPYINVTHESSELEKISLFRNLFRGREDVFPKRFESKRSGKSGYQPVCANEWIRPVCQMRFHPGPC